MGAVRGPEPRRSGRRNRAAAGRIEPPLPGVVTLETYLTPEQTTMERVKWIGRYALAPIWADGHDTGLFTYLRLREICQCAEHLPSTDDA